MHDDPAHPLRSEHAHATVDVCMLGPKVRGEGECDADTDPDVESYDSESSGIDGQFWPEPEPRCRGEDCGVDDVDELEDGFPDPPQDSWSPSLSPTEWASLTWLRLPAPLRRWIDLFEPSMRVEWKTMYDEQRTVLPVLDAFVGQVKPAERWAAVQWLFRKKGVLVEGEQGSDMFDDLLCGFRSSFGKIDFKLEDDLRSVRYGMAVADKFLSLVDEGGFSKAMVWDPLPRVIDPAHFRAGGLHSKAAKEAWHEMAREGPGVSKWVLDWVDNRVWYERLEPLEEDHSARNSKCFDDKEMAEFMDSKVAEMVRVGAVVLLPEGQLPKVLTRLSLAPKPGSGDKWRVIMDMRPENSRYRKRRIKMEHLDHVASVVEPGDVLYSLDMKSAYYSVGVDPRLGVAMGFQWRGKFYRFKVLPFGFVGSPHAFVKIGRNILKKWRAVGPGEWRQRFGSCDDADMRAGSKAMLYIDDSLGAHKYFAAAVWQRNAQMLELEKLGFALSAKGELLPFPAVRFLGMIIHLGRGTPSWHVPADKLAGIVRVSEELVEEMGEAGRVLCKKAAKCIGKLISASRAVPIGRMLFRELNLCIYSNGNPVWGGHTSLSPQALADLRFIIKCLQPYNLRGSPIWVSSYVTRVDKVLIQDSGPRAVGFALHDAPVEMRAERDSLDHLPVVAEGTTWWDRHVRSLREPQSIPALELATSCGTIELKDSEADLAHVQKELLGTFLALKSRRRELCNKRVCIFVDSVASIAYLVSWGGASVILSRIVRLIWGICVRWGIRIVQVSHISGEKMITAGVDALSRPPKFTRKKEADRDDWRLTDSAFEVVQELASKVFGAQLSIDRMASRANTRLKRFNSVSSADPDAENQSAFEVNWAVRADGAPEISYCFPPFSLIPRVVQHIKQCRARAVIIIPNWPSQSWWVNLWRIAVGHTLLLDRQTFETVSDGQYGPVLSTSFTAVAVAVDGSVRERDPL